MEPTLKFRKADQSLVKVALGINEQKMNSSKSVYFRMYTSDGYEAWYAIKVDSEEKLRCQDCGGHVNIPAEVEKGEGTNKEIVYKLSDPKFATLIYPISVMDSSMRGTCIAVGTTIYSIGGDSEKDVYCLDTMCSKNGWKRCHPMLCYRDHPLAALFDEKIYVIGDCHRTPDIWGEVYDPCFDNWEPLPPPLSGIWSGSYFIVLEAAKKILMIPPAANGVNLYDVITKTWYVFNQVHRFPQLRSNNDNYPLVVGDTFYWHSGFGCVNAYVSSQQLSLSVQIDLENEGLIPEINEDGANYPDIEHNYPCLLHLGGELFCLLWMDKKLYTDSYYGCIRCTKIRVSKVMDNKGIWYLTAYVVSTLSYLMHSSEEYIDGLVL